MSKDYEELSKAQRRQIVRMLESCGIEPKDVPVDTPFRRSGESVYLEVFIRGEDGRIRISTDGQSPACKEIEIRPRPELVPDWVPGD